MSVMCNKKGCNNLPFQDLAECALHCEKGNYSQDGYSGLLRAFYEDFKEYILIFLKEHDYSYRNETGFEEIAGLFDNDLERESLVILLKKTIFVPTHIKFPERDPRDDFDYIKLLNIFRKIHFDNCCFNIGYLNLKEVKIFFQDCVFYNYWTLYDYLILENVNNVIYQNCTFKASVSNKSSESEYEPYILTNNQFDVTCIFEKDLSINNTVFEKTLFNVSEASFYSGEQSRISRLDVQNVIFKDKFILNKTYIDEVYIKNCVFEDKFEFKENKTEGFEVDNVDFFKVSDFFATHFVLFKIKQVKFEDFTVFENCTFGLKGASEKEYLADFVYTTFMNFVNFRYTKFFSGLNLEKSNFIQSPNFLKAEIKSRHTNRETFRIIKSSFSKLENIIDSNKYYSKELGKYREELNSSKTPVFEEKLIFNVNYILSNFGQSYLRPIFWIIFLAALHYLAILGYEKSWLYSIYEPCNAKIAAISSFLNKVAANILPFKASLKEGLEFASLIFAIGYAILIWQVIAAFKIHTRKH